MKARDLATDLRSLGLECDIEVQGKLAVIIPTVHLKLDAKMRRSIVVRGREHGFTNVCIELNSVDATVSGH